MTVVTINSVGSAPADEAWDRYAQIARWSDWAPQITGVDASADRIAADVIGTVHGPLGVSARFKIDMVDEDARRWSWTVRRWPLTVRLQHGVRPMGRGSTTWLTIDAPIAVALGYVPLAKLALRNLVAR